TAARGLAIKMMLTEDPVKRRLRLELREHERDVESRLKSESRDEIPADAPSQARPIRSPGLGPEARSPGGGHGRVRSTRPAPSQRGRDGESLRRPRGPSTWRSGIGPGQLLRRERADLPAHLAADLGRVAIVDAVVDPRERNFPREVADTGP